MVVVLVNIGARVVVVVAVGVRVGAFPCQGYTAVFFDDLLWARGRRSRRGREGRRSKIRGAGARAGARRGGSG